MTAMRNGEIDFLRFVFAIIIVFYHFNLNYTLGFFVNGYIGVEFFFVVSGYLMAKHVERKNENYTDLGMLADETWHYLIGKVKIFYKYYFSVIILQVIIQNILIRHEGLAKIAYGLFSSIPTFTLTFMGLNYKGVHLYVGNTWYLSAMLIAIFILYPILLRHYKFSVEIVFPFIALFFLGYLVATNNEIAKWEEWSGIAYFGVFRAVAEMALGGSLFQLSVYLTSNSKMLSSSKRLAKYIITMVKILCYAIVIVFAYGSIFGETFKPGFNLHALLFCSLGVLLSFSNAGYCIPDSKITRYLGKRPRPYNGVN